MISSFKFFQKYWFLSKSYKSSQVKSHETTRSDWAVKWLSLISIRSEQVSKISSIVKNSSHPMHIGSSSPLNKKEWVIKEWQMCSRAITVSSFLFVWGTAHTRQSITAYCPTVIYCCLAQKLNYYYQIFPNPINERTSCTDFKAGNASKEIFLTNKRRGFMLEEHNTNTTKAWIALSAQ